MVVYSTYGIASDISNTPQKDIGRPLGGVRFAGSGALQFFNNYALKVAASDLAPGT